MQSTVLFVPGLRDHVADHWQTLLAAEIPGSRTVPPLEADRLSRAARVERLDQAIAAIDGPVILVAHSAGCLMVAHWAQSHGRPIKGALLATPADVETPLPPGYPTPEQLRDGGWLPTPRRPLPFQSILAASANDPLADFDRMVRLASDWGSQLVPLGDVGHLNPVSGFGPWSRGRHFIDILDAPVAAPATSVGG
ncbi:alpha/beta hydrolase [Caulobacter sp. Root1455]|uniref:RBBP9/YdeN family alpha/beta hydrolase n=1 Tax=Caulobacter sp. Root1455 TaxID=1736465 RepID=UPI0006F7F883|nr:alpha/beta fold hydrolase [Caulobacter sp. Root1455]KQY93793.1 alpha/beta hydrolase [Caulobacter sp. Root1455]